MESEQQPKTLGELKLLILSKVEELIFQTTQLSMMGHQNEAMTCLYHLFQLLPPDLKRDLKDVDPQIIEYRKKQMESSNTPYYVTDSYTRIKKYEEYSANFTEFIRITLGKIQDMLYERYLRQGYGGANLDEDLGKADEYEPEGETNET
jgi:hypothetical protein